MPSAASGPPTVSVDLPADPRQEAEVLRVVDGDTIDLLVNLGYGVFFRVRVRLFGVDTPETYGVKKTSDEYKAGKIATQFTKDWVKYYDDKVTVCGNHGTGKYGRWLMEICPPAEGKSLNKALIDSGNAKAYLGGKRR